MIHCFLRVLHTQLHPLFLDTRILVLSFIILSQMHWLKTDFDKWKDEDESDDEDPSGSFVRRVIHVVEL